MPKLAAAIITGTMARPSRPSVRFTALPAPTMMKVVKMRKNQPKSMMKSFRNGTARAVDTFGRPIQMIAKHAAPAMIASIARRVRPEKPACDCLVTFR